MNKVLKKAWRFLPPNIKDFSRPIIIKCFILISSAFSIQFVKDSMGKVNVPYFARFRLKKSFAEQGEDLILDRVFTRILLKDVFKPHTYVDVGAYDAIDHSVTYLLYLRGWKGIVFDPSLSTLKSFKRWRKKDIFVNAVVGEEDGVDVDFYIPKYALGDQCLCSTKYLVDNINDFDKLVFRQVNLDNELRRQGLKKIDVLNIDVEGSELEILKNFDFDFFKPSVIAVEIHGNDLEECLKSDVAQLILGKGYQYVGSAVITQFFARKDDIPI